MESLIKFCKRTNECEILKKQIDEEIEKLKSKKSKLDSDLEDEKKKLEICTFVKFMMKYNPEEITFLVIPTEKNPFLGWNDLNLILPFVSKSNDKQLEEEKMTDIQKYLRKFVKIIDNGTLEITCSKKDEYDSWNINIDEEEDDIEITFDSDFEEPLDYSWIKNNADKAHYESTKKDKIDYGFSDDSEIFLNIKSPVYILELKHFDIPKEKVL